MSRLPSTWTLASLKEFEKVNPQMPQFAHRMTAQTYDEFVQTIYVELASFARGLESDRNYFQEATENMLNSMVARHFNTLGYSAAFDKNKGGHADITVEFADYEWIGEGKIVRSVDNSYLTKGYDQLVYRYGLGKPGANQAAVLIYSFGSDTLKVVSKWAEHLNTINGSQAGYAEEIHLPEEQEGFALQCTHRHVGGGTLTIRGVGFQLYWNPPAAASDRMGGT
ncbi:hypothetical protein [Herbaspirillum seropedicae]|uniref:hypothetical protein n=1 Tax=Herbaspirillum seropedicae TaxID=964 RepID=UPI003D95F792